MKKAIALTAVISMTIFMLFSVSGCFNLGQKVAEKVTEKVFEKAIESEGGEAEVDIGEEGVSIKTDEGEMTMGEGVELPDGFPKVVPVYPDMQIYSSSKFVGDDEKEGFYVSGTTSDSGSTVFDWYKSQLSNWDTEESEVTSGGESMYTIYASNDAYDVSVIIMDVESEDEVMVTLSVNEL
ncbi:MAG: hypothetical protein KJ568_03430 [Actinobacteria bacterium]|nr:hypothetical protein [Actinomycetota bacterium]